MVYYHCSPAAALSVLEPKTPAYFDKPGAVYMTTLRPMALMYGVRNFEYTYGYTKDGRLVYEEYYPDALRTLYAGHAASLYICAPEKVETTRIPNEVISDRPVPVVSEERITDVYRALLEEEAEGNLVIRRYDELGESMKAWIEEAEMKEILERGLLMKPCDMADYMKRHYPASWEKAIRVNKNAAHSV